MAKRVKSILLVSALAVIPTLLLWLPFFMRLKSFWTIPLPPNGLASIVANYDGPLYIVIAKTFYNTTAIAQNFEFPLPTEYYAAHFPMYPIFIKLLATVTNYPYAMLGATVISSIAALYFFYLLAAKRNPKQALWLTAVFAIFPARWLTVRSVGSPEPLFIATILASVYYFQNKKYLLAGIAGALAALTKSPGILLFGAYLAYLIIPKLKRLGKESLNKWLSDLNIKAWPVLLMPLALIGLFVVYKYQFSDFFAYFHSGDNIHLFFPPFQIFNYSAPWVGTFWLEEVIYIYLFASLGLVNLIKQKEYLMAWFVGIFFTTIIFVSHRDVARYALPMLPFIILAFSDTLVKKEVKTIITILAIPVYLASLAFISQNTMSIANWTPLL